MSAGYRSVTEYLFAQEQADDIARISAYHRKDFAMSVNWFPPRTHLQIRDFIATPFRRTSNVGLGAFDLFPLEVSQAILSILNMDSLFKFRQVNLRSRQTVDSLRQYQLIVSHGLNCLCALLRTQVACSVSLLEFYSALCTKVCFLCGDFGGFLSLLTWRRSCFKCLRGASETQVQTLNTARKEYQLTKDELRQLRSFKTLPGVYSMEESKYKSRIAIVSIHQAGLFRRRQSQTRRRLPLASLTRMQKYNFMGSCALPYYDKFTGQVEHGISCAGCQLAIEKFIIGAQAERWAFEARDKVYSQDGFLEHFRWCEQAQLLWKSSIEGQKRPRELPGLARRGGYFGSRE